MSSPFFGLPLVILGFTEFIKPPRILVVLKAPSRRVHFEQFEFLVATFGTIFLIADKAY